VIAMAVPSAINAPYRNDIFEVARFFSEKHYGRFLVFNLCEEFEEAGNGNYASSHFYGIVSRNICKSQPHPGLWFDPSSFPHPHKIFPSFHRSVNSGFLVHIPPIMHFPRRIASILIADMTFRWRDRVCSQDSDERPPRSSTPPPR
jgi:hypothetical protein